MEVCIVKLDWIFFKEDVEELFFLINIGYIGIFEEYVLLVIGLDNGVFVIC